jgi:hypothetical protein
MCPKNGVHYTVVLIVTSRVTVGLPSVDRRLTVGKDSGTTAEQKQSERRRSKEKGERGGKRGGERKGEEVRRGGRGGGDRVVGGCQGSRA